MVQSLGNLDAALAQSHWGSVIEVASDVTISIPDQTTRTLGAGVTLRGARRGLVDGPLIHRTNIDEGTTFFVTGPNVRITGLRLRGHSTSTDNTRVVPGSVPPLFPRPPPPPPTQEVPKVDGIMAVSEHRTLIDHTELSGWTGAAVSTYQDGIEFDFCNPPQTSARIRVLRNYIHDNARQGAGYGVVSGVGGNAYVGGNTFAKNRHAVSATHHGQTRYTAEDNLVLDSSNRYCSVWPFCWKEQDLDVHGSEDPGHWEGGRAGFEFSMGFNTFYATGKNIHIRGTPCSIARIYNNVFRESRDTAIESNSEVSGRVQRADSNAFQASTDAIVIGDFDGDGALDEFMATGAAWYYRAGRTKEWRFLRRASERSNVLSFGDFDGDRRTDVRMAYPGGSSDTSWGASSPWDRFTPIVWIPISLSGGAKP